MNSSQHFQHLELVFLLVHERIPSTTPRLLHTLPRTLSVVNPAAEAAEQVPSPASVSTELIPSESTPLIGLDISYNAKEVPPEGSESNHCHKPTPSLLNAPYLRTTSLPPIDD